MLLINNPTCNLILDSDQFKNSDELTQCISLKQTRQSMKILFKFSLFILLLSSFVSCATIRRIKNYPESPQIYGGVREHVVYFPTGHLPMHSPGGSPEAFGFAVMFTGWWMPFDFILCAGLDTVFLPLTMTSLFYEEEVEESF